MTWLYTPLASAPGSEDSILESSWLFPALAQFASWRGKLRPVTSWERVCRKGGWLPRLCGQILEPSTAQRGVDAWISLQRGIPVPHFPLRENGKERKTRATSGPRFGESWAKYDRATSSWKMCQGTFGWDSTESLEILPTLGSMRNGAFIQPLRQEAHNSDLDSSCLAIPAAQEAKEGLNLSLDAQRWPTPDAGVINDSEDVTSFFTRRARLRKEYNNGNGAGVPLAMKVRVWCPVPPHGPQGQEMTGQESQRSSSLRLNPNFATWLMGFPFGWISFEPLGMPFVQSKPLSPSET